MKKSILFFTILLFLFSVSSWARVPEATDPFSKTESTIPKIVKSEARPTIPEGFTPKRMSKSLKAPIFDDYKPERIRSRGGLAVVWEENFEPDAGLFYYENFSYLWYCPEEFTKYAVRYTPFHDGTLDGAYIYFYGSTTATSVDFYVYDDNGSNYPGSQIGSNLGYTPTAGTWNYIDLSLSGINVVSGEDFFIILENVLGGSAHIISDDGTCTTGVNRSLVWDGAAWVYAIDDPYCGAAYEWWIDAMITYNDPWTSALGKWELHEDGVRDSAHSAPFCWWVDEVITGGFKDYLTSPEFCFDPDENYDLYNFSLWVDIEFMRSSAGPGSIDEYYEVWIADMDAVPTDWWHIDAFNGYDANSWWCGDEGLSWPGGWGYGNSWNQWVQTPNMSLPTNRALYLDFMHRYDTEPAYDFCYVEISTDNWITFDQLAVYDDIMTTWTAVNIDISAYAGDDASIRFRFESDGAYSDEDNLYPSEGAWFIDDVSVNDGARTTYFVDNADDEVNFLVNVGNFEWVRLFYDYDRDYPAPSTGWELVDKNFIFNGTCNITPYAGKNIQLMIAAQVDDSTYADGAGLYIDDISITGIALPEFDTQCDFLVVPYPTTEEAVTRALLDPKIIYHQAGYGSSGANGMCDVEGTGLEYPLYDFREAGMPALAMGEYGISDLTLQMEQYTPTAGNWNFKGWVDGAFEERRGDSFAPDMPIKIYPPGEYELGYNARALGGYYYPTCTGAVTKYTPFTDGIFTVSRDTYEINGIKHLIYNRGLDYGTEACLEFYVYGMHPLSPDQFGTELYYEEICFAITPEERFTWIEIPFATPVEVTGDFWIHVTGPFIGGACPHEPGYFDYHMLVDSGVMFEDQLGANVYEGHPFTYVPDARYTLTEYPSNFYINALINTEVPSSLNAPQNVTIVESAGSVTISWDAVRFASSYTVYSDTDPYGLFTTIEQAGIAGLTWNGTATGEKKFYVVKASN